jgi:hypothetical protein
MNCFISMCVYLLLLPQVVSSPFLPRHLQCPCDIDSDDDLDMKGLPSDDEEVPTPTPNIKHGCIVRHLRTFRM